MEGLTRLVTESLARHGFDRPLDYRRLRWSRWFRCESHHSLLLVPSKPGVFALAEEVADFGTDRVGADPLVRPASEASVKRPESNSAGETAPRRMLAVVQFFEDDDMAFVLDRMLARPNPLRDALNSGRYFVRYVVIEDASQRRSVRTALNQWLAEASENAVGIGSDTSSIGASFASSLELTPATEYVPAAQANLFDNASAGPTLLSAKAGAAKNPDRMDEIKQQTSIAAPQPGSEAATNIQCPSPFPSGF
jgi:hypothetical protein